MNDRREDDYEERVRRRAYQLWEEEGRPDGRDKVHWEEARELVAIEDNQRLATKPVHRDPDDPTLAADEAEPAGPAANEGELPALTDQGEQVYPPSREAEIEAGRK